MRRREFITALGGAAAWPLAAGAQQMRRVGMLIGGPDNTTARDQDAAFREGLVNLGWIEGRNLRIDQRFGQGDPERNRTHFAELVRLAPEVIVVSSQAVTLAMLQQTRTIPIVFISIGPLGGNNPIVKDIARPEGNATGSTNLFASIGGKWLELLKEAAPHISRIAVIFNPELTGGGILGPGYLNSIDEAASLFAMKVIRAIYRKVAELVRTIDGFAAERNGALLVIPSAAIAHGDLILRLAAEHHLPAIYPDKTFAAGGGLLSYGSDIVDLWRRAPTYVDRLLRGAKVRELPVQFPTKFEMVVNLKTAKEFGLVLPQSILLRADEVIE